MFWRAAFWPALYRHTRFAGGPAARYSNRQRLPVRHLKLSGVGEQPLTIGNCSVSFGTAFAGWWNFKAQAR